MARSLTALLVALAVLVPGAASSSAAAQMAGMGTHACCLRMQSKACAGTTITCCPAPERGRESTAPSSSSTAAGTAQPNGGHPSSTDALLQPPVAKALAFDAHAHVRANAPPGPLYLRHLTLLV